LRWKSSSNSKVPLALGRARSAPRAELERDSVRFSASNMAVSNMAA
jgi:hypothetical protein